MIARLTPIDTPVCGNFPGAVVSSFPSVSFGVSVSSGSADGFDGFSGFDGFVKYSYLILYFVAYFAATESS